jgi:hypothetical protein
MVHMSDFTNLEPGKYTLSEINLPGYPCDISDKDVTDDGDDGDQDMSVDNMIKVTLVPGEKDADINFIGCLASGSPSRTPSIGPSYQRTL